MQRVIRQSLSWEVMRVGEHAYAAMPTASLHEAWFSLEVQRYNLMQRCAVDLVIDAGANVGQFGCAIRRKYAGELISFEPSSGPFGKLSEAAASDPLWHVQNIALGAQEDQLTLKIAPLSVLNSFLPASAFSHAMFGERSKSEAHETVRVRRMDQALEEIVPDATGRRLFVKLDTQGFDLQVFKGMQGILDTVVLLQAEVSLRPIYDGMPGWLESLAVYESAGFRVAGLFPAVCDDAGLPIEYDCLMYR